MIRAVAGPENTMAKCNFCKREMLTANGCGVAHEQVYDDAGTPLGRKRRPKVTADEASNGRCGDCCAKPGYYHHPGCDLERCIVCGGQALGCIHYFSLEQRAETE
jgi:hypothetical protein